MNARGEFEVDVKPLKQYNEDVGAALGRMSIDKRFRGDLEGTSKGEMLTAMSGIEGSAGYVAVERVSGSLGGRRGTFELMHSGVMNRGAQRLEINVVPDSGTDELTGLSGAMKIIIQDGKHSYDFEYSLNTVR